MIRAFEAATPTNVATATKDDLEPRTNRRGTLEFDEHGVPFCRHCLGGTDQIGFLVKPAQGRNGQARPVLRVRCAAPQANECLGVQEWDCRRDPTRLLPVWRTHPAYTEARLHHQTLERATTRPAPARTPSPAITRRAPNASASPGR
jgi:hypothetical protein